MVLTQGKCVSGLIEKHGGTINLLKTKVEAQYPDLKTNGVLTDGTVVDDLFYLRYILSSKDDLSDSFKLEDSKTLKNLYYAINYRNTQSISVTEEDEAIVQSIVPLTRTGELENGFPVIFLPVKEIDFERLTGDKRLEQQVLSTLLAKRSALFKELDAKTRKSGEIVKSLTIYDLQGLSYSDIFKLKGFFKLVQGQSKVFKKLFPQCTEMTVFVNVSAAYLVKSFLTSSKQKVWSVAELHRQLDCRDAVPDLIGGSYPWSRVGLVELTENQPEINPLKVQREVKTEYATTLGKNRKFNLDQLEREMVQLKKNRLFSINVVEKRQTVDLYFTNLKEKEANVLIITKQENITSKRKVSLPQGFSSVPLKLTTVGEILVVYLDTKKSLKYARNESNMEKMKLKRSPPKALLRFGRKKLQKLSGKNTSTELEVQRLQNELVKSGLKCCNKVLFRFEVNDSVLCGSDTSVSDSDLQSLISDTNSEGLVEFDALSLCSKDSAEVGGLLSGVTQILTNGLY